MASEKRSVLQDSFLNEARVRRTPVTVFMTNGFQQRGVISSDRKSTRLNSSHI